MLCGGGVWVNGMFSIKSFHEKLLGREEEAFPCNAIWILKVSAKVCFFTWLATWGVIWWQKILESGRLSASAGVICVRRRERQGSSSSSVWSFHEVMVEYVRWFGTSWATPRTVKLKESLLSWKGRRKRRRHRAWNVVPLELIWVVWRERNMNALRE